MQAEREERERKEREGGSAEVGKERMDVPQQPMTRKESHGARRAGSFVAALPSSRLPSLIKTCVLMCP